MKRKKKPSMHNLRNKVKKWEETEYGVEVTLYKTFVFLSEMSQRFIVFDSVSQAKQAVINAVEI